MSELASMPSSGMSAQSRCRRVRWAMAALLLLAAGIFLLGNRSVSLWDRDEPRYAQCSREMLQHDDWVVPTLLGAWRTAKPPLIYWCEATAMRFLGDTPFAARFPSVVAMLLLLTMLAVTIYRAVGPARAMATVFVLATSVLILYDAKQCLTDSVLLLWITIAQLSLFAIYQGHKSWLVVSILWIAQGLAMLTKGPVGVGVSLATLVALAAMDYALANEPNAPTYAGLNINAKILAWWRRFFTAIFRGSAHAARTWWRDTRPVAGLIILTAICGPWIILIHQRALGFLDQMLDIFGKHVVEGTEQHAGPPGWHLTVIWGTFLPWSLFLPVTLTIAWKQRRLPVVRFALAAVLGTWVLVECIRTKLPHYFLPAFVPLAFLTGDALVRCLRGQYHPLSPRAYRIMATIFAIVLLALGGAPWLLTLPDLVLRPQPWTALIIWSVTALVFAILASLLLWNRRLRPAIITMGLGTMGLVAILYGLYLPQATFIQLPLQIANCLKQEGATHVGDAATIQYKEHSVFYYQGGTLETKEDDFFKKNPLPAAWPRWLVLTDDIWNQASPKVQANFKIVQRFHGLNYVGAINGKHIVDVMVIRKKDDSEAIP